jgi:pilus assembly protein Flp/PilA
MNQFIKSINTSVSAFMKEEEGSQVVEYSLIIAVVSIGLVVALGGATSSDGLRGAFTALVDRVIGCFGATGCDA